MYVQFKSCVFGFIVKFKHPQQGDVFIAELEDGMAYLKDILLLWSFKETAKDITVSRSLSFRHRKNNHIAENSEFIRYNSKGIKAKECFFIRTLASHQIFFRVYLYVITTLTTEWK